MIISSLNLERGGGKKMGFICTHGVNNSTLHASGGQARSRGMYVPTLTRALSFCSLTWVTTLYIVLYF